MSLILHTTHICIAKMALHLYFILILFQNASSEPRNVHDTLTTLLNSGLLVLVRLELEVPEARS